jgi:hypothetical protein
MSSFVFNGKEHKGRNLRLLDPADEIAQRECTEKGCDLIPFSIAYEHMFDNFMTYARDDRPCDEIVNRTRELVFHAIFNRASPRNSTFKEGLCPDFLTNKHPRPRRNMSDSWKVTYLER